MTSVDLAVLGVMVLSGLLAFSRGLVREVLSIAAWLGAAVVALEFVPAVRGLLAPYMPSPEWVDPACYILLFLIALIVFTLIAKTLGGMVRTSAIGGIDRTLGFVFGLARGAALAVVAYIIASLVTPPERWPAQVLESRSLPYIYNGAVWAARQIPQEYQPQVPPPPPVGKQAALSAILTTSPTGRASDPPIRR
jgi:membrane protein required for colicin V production